MSSEQGPPTQTVTAERSQRWWRRPAVLVPLVLLLVIVLTIGAWLFQPWKLFTDEVVDEALPLPAAASSAPTSPGTTPEPTPEPQVLAKGRFISHEHETTGRAEVLQLPDGKRVLRFEDLKTSNGPDLKVWLAAAPVIPGTDGWFVFDDDEFEDLGPLKGNIGNQNYRIPDSVDLKQLSSVSIWCDRFSVSFGAAELKLVD